MITCLLKRIRPESSLVIYLWQVYWIAQYGFSTHGGTGRKSVQCMGSTNAPRSCSALIPGSNISELGFNGAIQDADDVLTSTSKKSRALSTLHTDIDGCQKRDNRIERRGWSLAPLKDVGFLIAICAAVPLPGRLSIGTESDRMKVAPIGQLPTGGMRTLIIP